MPVDTLAGASSVPPSRLLITRYVPCASCASNVVPNVSLQPQPRCDSPVSDLDSWCATSIIFPSCATQPLAIRSRTGSANVRGSVFGMPAP